MSYFGTMQVLDESGWSKTFSLEKALTMIGSAAFNDLVLPKERGNGVADVHLQLIRLQAGAQGFRLVNLVNEPLNLNLSRARGAAVLGPNGSRTVEDGDAVQVGSFTITFYLRAVNGVTLEKRSENLGVRLEMPGVDLRPGTRLAGLLTVKNFGGEKRSQFEIDLEGLSSDCYQIDPAPLLYPGGEEKLQIRFFHRGIRPAAGKCPVYLRVSAVSAYPTEEVCLPLVLDVEPVYRCEVALMDDLDSMDKNFAAVLPLPELNTADSEALSFVSDQPAARPIRRMDETSSGNGKAAPSAEVLSNQPMENTAVMEGTPHLSQASSQDTDADWWSEGQEDALTHSPSDPLAQLKRGGKPKLSVENSNIQVLKAAAEDLLEKNENTQSDDAERD